MTDLLDYVIGILTGVGVGLGVAGFALLAAEYGIPQRRLLLGVIVAGVTIWTIGKIDAGGGR